MKIFKKSSTGEILGLAAACAALGFFFGFTQFFEGPPSRQILTRASGVLEWVRDDGRPAGGVMPRFKFAGNPIVFQYPTKCGNGRLVLRELRAAPIETVEVLYDESNPFTPPFRDFTVYKVYEIKIDGRTIRAYRDAVQAWNDDNEGIAWMIIAFGLTGLLCVIEIVRRWAASR